MKVNKKISKKEYDRLKRIEETAKTVCLANAGDIPTRHKHYYELEEALKPAKPELTEGYLYWYRYGKTSPSSTKMKRFYTPGDEKNYTITKLTHRDWIDTGAYIPQEVMLYNQLRKIATANGFGSIMEAIGVAARSKK